MKINIVCAGNRNCIIPMKVMVKSLAVNTRKNVEIFVLNYICLFDYLFISP